MKIQSNSSRCWLPALAWQKPIISTLCIVIAAMFTLVATAQEPNPAPPQVYIDTTWNPPIQGGTWTVNSSSTFQLALNMAQPGQTIVLNNSSVYSGNFTLPAKTNPNNQWIYIESSARANLPPPGTRVSRPPVFTSRCCKLVSDQVSNKTGWEGRDQQRGARVGADGTLCRAKENIGHWNTSMCDPDHRQAIPCRDLVRRCWELKRKFRMASSQLVSRSGEYQ